jgi:predicted glutamine amidotransferase
MCGVYGINYGPAGPDGEAWSPSELMQLMFPAIVHRGKHAWGYFYHEQGQDEVDYFVKQGSAAHPDAIADMVIDATQPLNWLGGHVRFATNGRPQYLANNHPILHGNILGIHNGVLRDWRHIITTTGREDPKAEVDSEAIFAAVNKWGVMEGLRRIHGDMVTAFVDLREPGVLYLARTFGRPLWYGHTKAGSLVWASEPQVIEETGLELAGPLVEWKKSNRVWKIVQGKVVSDRQFRKLERPAITPPPAAPRPITPSGAFGAGAYTRDRWGGTYLGANMWRVRDGDLTVTLTGEKYIELIVSQQLKEEVQARAVVVAEKLIAAHEDKVRAAARDEARAAMLATLERLTVYLDGKTAKSSPEPGELDDDMAIRPEPEAVVIKEAS